MTGDNRRTAACVAEEVGVDEFHAEVLPEDKADFIRRERAAGHTVIMIGDGVNDSLPCRRPMPVSPSPPAPPSHGRSPISPSLPRICSSW